MVKVENPQYKIVRHFEKAIDTKKPENLIKFYDWASSVINDLPRVEKNSPYQDNSKYIIDKVRSFPHIEEADRFFKTRPLKNPLGDELIQYQTNGQWNYQDDTLKELKNVVKNHENDPQSFIYLAIEMFGKAGNIRGLTNFFHYVEELNILISPFIQLEALFLAEVSLAKNLLEMEEKTQHKKVVRISEVKKQEEHQKFVEKDPILHLFRGYRLAEIIEAMLTGQI